MSRTARLERTLNGLMLVDATAAEVAEIEGFLQKRRDQQAKRHRKVRTGSTVSALSHPKLFAILDDGSRTHFSFDTISIFEVDRAEADVARMTKAELKRKYPWI